MKGQRESVRGNTGTDASGRRLVVEMQAAKVERIEKRIVYNASNAYVMQLRSADTYPTLCDVVGVTICDVELWPDGGEGGRLKVPMLSRWRMQEQHSGARAAPGAARVPGAAEVRGRPRAADGRPASSPASPRRSWPPSPRAASR
ncbi:hypothetical protein [Sorangium sp. So ce385]|uniref:hypothetical protein n=1 Tax=Sorangium sp. So ce385 TaxID=3133308 RepID=UPI003F5AFBDC